MRNTQNGIIRAAFFKDESIGVDYDLRSTGSNITHVNEDFPKGTCILVGNKRPGGKVKIDAVNLAIARALQGGKGNPVEFQLLDKAEIKDKETIYLAAHGVFRTRSIDGRPLKEVAEKLVEAGFNGSQKIISFACDSDKKGVDLRTQMAGSMLGGRSGDKTMNEELADELITALAARGKKLSKGGVRLSRFANGKTIVLNCSQQVDSSDERTNADMWVVNPKETGITSNLLLAQRALMYYGNYYTKLGTKKIEKGHKFNLEKDIPQHLVRKLDSMDRFKFSLVQTFLTGKRSNTWGAGYDKHTLLNTLEMIALAVGGILGLIEVATLLGEGTLNYAPVPAFSYITAGILLFSVLTQMVRSGEKGAGFMGWATNFLFSDILALILVLAGVALTNFTAEFLAFAPFVAAAFAVWKFIKTLYVMFC